MLRTRLDVSFRRWGAPPAAMLITTIVGMALVHVDSHAASDTGENVSLLGRAAATQCFATTTRDGDDHVYAGNGCYLDVLLFPVGQSATRIGRLRLPGLVKGIALQGDHAYVANAEDGLRVVDISNPASPTQTGALPLSGNAVAVQVSGSFAYVALEQGGFRVVDVGNPSNPVPRGWLNLYAVDIALYQNYAVVAGDGTTSVNVTNPDNPVETASWSWDAATGVDIEDTGPASPIVRVVGGIWPSGWLATGTLDPSDGSLDGFEDPPPITLGGEPTDVHFRQIETPQPINTCIGPRTTHRVVYMADDVLGLAAYHIKCQQLWTQDGPWGNRRALAVTNDAVYAGSGGGIEAFDLSIPFSPSYWAVSPTPDLMFSVEVSGDYVYGLHASGLHIFLRSPSGTEYTEVASLPTGGWAKKAAIFGSYAYVGTEYDGLKVVNISNPSSPSIVASIPFYWVTGLAVNVTGSRLYAAEYLATSPYYRLKIFDLAANPAAPTLLKTIPMPNFITDIAVPGSYVYLSVASNPTAKLVIVDASNPPTASVVGTYTFTGGTGQGVAVAGTTAYLAVASEYNGTFDGLKIINVSNPASPMSVGSFATPDDATGVVVIGMHAFVAAGRSGLRVVKVNNPASPVEKGFYDTGSVAYDIAWDVVTEGYKVLVADLYAGLYGLSFMPPPGGGGGGCTKNCPTQSELQVSELMTGIHAVRPNPFASATAIHFSTAQACMPEIQILDVQGRRVLDEQLAEHPPGTWQWSWNGADADGRPALAGVYFVRLRLGAHIETRRLVKLAR